MAFYLDPTTRDTGALRVIPGSHRVGEPFADALERHLRNGGFGIDPSTVPQLPSNDARRPRRLHHSIKHSSSFGGSGRRRMYTMNFAERYPEDKLPELERPS